MHTKEEDYRSFIEHYTLKEYDSLFGKRVLIRVDWNMPVLQGKIVDTSRATATFEFLRSLSRAGARIIIMSHFGEKGESIETVATYIQKELPFITFASSKDFETLHNASINLSEGSGILIENVRLWSGETENIPSLSQSFASLGELFVNNAFSVSHRIHASVVGVASYLPSYFGPTCVHEIVHLHKVLTPTLPALLIIGGAKIATKLPLIQHYLNLGVSVFVGGAMVHNIWKAKGLQIGNSLCDSNYTVPPFLLEHPSLFTPIDVKLDTGKTTLYDEIPTTGTVVDIGEKSVEEIKDLVNHSRTVIMNGPLGLYEKGWLSGTEQVLQTIAHSHTESYIGGGDTVTVAQSLNVIDSFTFVSLGGGAMLDYLSSGTLPGIDAVTKR